MQFAYVILLHRGGAFCWVPFFLFADVSGRNFSFVIRSYSFVSFHEGAGAISSLFSRGLRVNVSKPGSDFSPQAAPVHNYNVLQFVMCNADNDQYVELTVGIGHWASIQRKRRLPRQNQRHFYLYL